MEAKALSREEKLRLLADSVRAYKDFPSPGILFRDICPVLKDPKAFTAMIDLFEEHLKKSVPDVSLIVGKCPRVSCHWGYLGVLRVTRVSVLKGHLIGAVRSTVGHWV
uniref:adenine phosphoribosyltransferase n=1 Tax=Latimeria chalumnae TaxID=7897 RepID=H2ZS01_LATCH|nr:PREDICTED: adenine phosphoribosyltransferase-like [Latimeria chalumnae]|eukprot:XP_014339904.1 PREDICTED: adenine phosphoribosyltransferase-like [Latimeria chalumnae]